jgi:ribosomal protein S18 acetylase RimI-like enzyme
LGDVPVLAVHPSYRGQGHGRSIVEQIFASAVIAYHWAKAGDEDSDHLFLDVYAANEPAISLYRKCGFEVLNPDARIPDPEENNETYLVMAKRISIAPE